MDVPEAIADEIEEKYAPRAAGFGSVKVEVAIGRAEHNQRPTGARRPALAAGRSPGRHGSPSD
ncbi:hypothetical protein [Nocardia sp. CA-119907]|uniref:hypothetical protein n=1 Tax=Nocardia sp. CA-119907 TaxID=3239973 RepID=UPI003D97C067